MNTQGKFKKVILILALAAVLVLMGLACKPKTEGPAPAATAPGGQPGAATELEGTIRISGAWALYPMMVRWGEEYSKIHPKVRVDVSAGGAGKGAADALAELVDIGMVSREIKPEELAQGGVFAPVCKDAVFPTINAANPVLDELKTKGIKRQALSDLFIAGKEMSWNEVFGGTGGEAVQVFTRSDSCGAAETWALYLGGKAQDELQGVAVYGDPGLADAVRRDVLSIGFNNLNFVFDMQSGRPAEGILVAPIDVNETGVVDPEEQLETKEQAVIAVATGKYPSPPARALNLLTKTKFKGLAKDFVLWILTDGQKYLDEVGYIPVTDEMLKSAIEQMKK